MTYNDFLTKVFHIPEAEYNDIANWSLESLSLVDIGVKYSMYDKIRFYERLFDMCLKSIIEKYDIDYYMSTFRYNFLFFTLDSKINHIPEKAKSEIIEKYYQLFNIYKKHHIDKIKEKSLYNDYQEEVLLIEPRFTKENIDKLMNEFDDSYFENIWFDGNFNCTYYDTLIYKLFIRYIHKSDINTSVALIAHYYLNKRIEPKDITSDLLNELRIETTPTMKQYFLKYPNVKERVLEIYNKFIYWFELDRSFTI